MEGSVRGSVRVMIEASVPSSSDSVQSGQASDSSTDGKSTSDESSKKLEKTKSEEQNSEDVKEMFGPSSLESERESPESSSDSSSTPVREIKSYTYQECYEVEGDIISLFTPVAYEKQYNGRVTVLGHEHHAQPVSLKYIDGVDQLYPLLNCVIISEHEEDEPMGKINLVHIGNTFTNASMNPISHCGVQGRSYIERLFSIFYDLNPQVYHKSQMLEYIFYAFWNISTHKDLYTNKFSCTNCGKPFPNINEKDSCNPETSKAKSKGHGCYSCPTLCYSVFCHSCIHGENLDPNHILCCDTTIKSVVELKYLRYECRREVFKIAKKQATDKCWGYHCIHQVLVHGLKSSVGENILPMPIIKYNAWLRLLYLMQQFKVFVLHLDGSIRHSVSCMIDNGGLEYNAENHPWLEYNSEKEINDAQPTYHFQTFNCATKSALTLCIVDLGEATSAIQSKEKLYVFMFLLFILPQILYLTLLLLISSGL